MNFIYKRIIKAFTDNGLNAAREKYADYFIHTSKNERYKVGVDNLLIENDYEEIIVIDDTPVTI